MGIKLTKAEAEQIILNSRKSISESNFYIECLIRSADGDGLEDSKTIDSIYKGIDYHKSCIKINNKILTKLGEKV